LSTEQEQMQASYSFHGVPRSVMCLSLGIKLPTH